MSATRTSPADSAAANPPAAEPAAATPAPAPAPAAAVKTPAKTVKPAKPVKSTKAVAVTPDAKRAPAKKAAADKALKSKAAAKPAAAKAPAAEDKAAKAKKPKLVRDSFTIPKEEYAAIETLKQRSGQLAQTAKKSELLRAGLKLLATLSDDALLKALQAVPSIKTGRPKAEPAPVAAPAASAKRAKPTRK